MKLLYCNTCGDIVKLGMTTRTCQCGSCGGHYREDGVNAIYYGPAVPIGYTSKGKPETSAQRRRRQQFNITKSYPYTKLANPPRRARRKNKK